MPKRQMLNDEEAKQMLAGSGKPKAKGKKRRSEIEHDAELEGKLTKKVSEHKREKQHPEHDSKVPAGSLRGVMGETIARVYEEIWPGMAVREHDDPNDEIMEEAYILSLTMLVGNNVDLPRTSMRIREADLSGRHNFCKQHAA